MSCLLEVSNLSKSFYGVQALADYSLRLEANVIHGVIGPNGAGKTTLFNCLTGFIKPTSGNIWLEGKDITTLSAHQVARRGVARTFQNIRLFGTMSVIENVKVALAETRNTSLLGALLSTPTFRSGEQHAEQRAMDLLNLVGLAQRRDQEARSLPYGDQRKLEIARAVALQPRVLLLDEPSAGMNPTESLELFTLIKRLREVYNITVVIIAHDIPLVMGVCERIQVLNYGRLIAEGDPISVRGNPDVIAAYLGTQRSAES